MTSAVRYSNRVTKADWYSAGGFANPRCWRRERSGVWQYFITRG